MECLEKTEDYPTASNFITPYDLLCVGEAVIIILTDIIIYITIKRVGGKKKKMALLQQFGRRGNEVSNALLLM